MTHERRQTKREVSKVDIPDGTEYTKCQAFFPVVLTGSAHPLTRKGVLLLSLLGPMGETHSLWGGGGGFEPIRTVNQLAYLLLRSTYYVIFTGTSAPTKYQSITHNRSLTPRSTFSIFFTQIAYCKRSTVLWVYGVFEQ